MKAMVIRLADGFVYLTAIIDWYSRKVLSWDLSLTLDKSSGTEVLGRALRRYGQPEYFNSDHAGRSLYELLGHASGDV